MLDTTTPGAGPAQPAASLASDRHLKILYSHRTQSRDGQFVHIQELVDALRATGHEVIVVEPRHVEATELGYEPKGVNAIKTYLPGFLYELMELAYSLPEFLRLAEACRNHRPDLLYQRANLFMLSGVVCAQLFGVPYFLEVNAPLAEERHKFGNLKLIALARWSERLAWRAADLVLPVTRVLARMIEHSGVPPDRISVVPNGVNLERFPLGDAKSFRSELSLDGKLVLGFTGFVREWHRADLIIDLLAGSNLPPNSHFLIVGDGPSRDELLRQAVRRGVADRVTITGIVQRDVVAQYIQCFNIALQPDVVAYASPLKLIEYMALARPIIAPDSENVRELLVNERSAVLVEPGNVTALAAALQRLANDAALRDRLGAAARDTVLTRGLTWRGNAAKIAALAAALAKKS